MPLEHGSQLDNIARLRRLLANGYVQPIMQRARQLHIHICHCAGTGRVSFPVRYSLHHCKCAVPSGLDHPEHCTSLACIVIRLSTVHSHMLLRPAYKASTTLAVIQHGVLFPMLIGGMLTAGLAGFEPMSFPPEPPPVPWDEDPGGGMPVPPSLAEGPVYAIVSRLRCGGRAYERSRVIVQRV